MIMWMLELFDRWYNCSVISGVFSTEEKASAASDILFRQLSEKKLKNPEERFECTIEPVYLDSFIDAAIEWIAD